MPALAKSAITVLGHVKWCSAENAFLGFRHSVIDHYHYH